MSTNSDGDNDTGVSVSMAGLALQVVVIVAFLACFGDYMFRYWRSGRMDVLSWRLKTFFSGLLTSILFILARCAYRVAELRDGYDGDIITHEIPFIVLEGVFIVVAAIALCFGHPGLVFDREQATSGTTTKAVNSDTESGNAGAFTTERK
jgi:hypothetical protein